MTEREKVVKGLECCHEGGRCGYDGSRAACPYFKKDGEAGACVGRLIDDAYDLLKEQEAVKPKKDDAWPYPIWVCGVCGTCLFKVGDYKPNFCSECGRAVKWENE